VDGMTTDEFGRWLREHWVAVREALDAGTYRPSLVRRVVIPKPVALIGSSLFQVGLVIK
jgi:RNA-directed DNA polymerase